MEFQYSYLITDLGFLLFWIVLYWFRSDLRKEMLSMSFMLGIFALLSEPVVYQDWWQPLTITGTIPGIESFLFGFTVGGIAAVIYEALFSFKLLSKQIREEERQNQNKRLLFISGLILVVFFGGFFIFHINSFLVSMIAITLCLIVILGKRPDLAINAVVSGVLLLWLTVIVYAITEWLTPGWIYQFWLFHNVPQIVIANIPIDDIFTYLGIGAVFGPLYEYWRGAKLQKI